MPGIFGIINKNEKHSPASTLKAMLSVLRHNNGYHIEQEKFNNSAFAAVSVSGKDTFCKVTWRDTEFIILLDGFIYKIAGSAVTSLADAGEKIVEICLSDPERLTEIEGNYSLSIYDVANKNLYLFNDMIAPRRMYYYNSGDHFIFASEIKGITRILNSTDMDWSGIADFLNYGYLLGDKTYFKDIKSVPSASVIHYGGKPKKLSVKKYWKPQYTSEQGTIEDFADEGNRLLTQSLNEKLSNGDHVINPISGGLDSRIILGTLTHLEKDLSVKPVTYGQRFSYEFRNAKRVCRSLGLDGHELVTIKPDDLLEKYNQAVWLSEGMISLNNAHLLLLHDHLGQNYDYALNGIYGGPTNYSAEYYAERHLNASLDHRQKVQDISNILAINLNTYTNISEPDFGKILSERYHESIQEEFKHHESVSDQFAFQRDAFFIENRMRRAINQSSLYRFFWEEQLPLSSYDLYHFYLKTPGRYRLKRRLLKTMLLRRFPGLSRIPDANTGLNLYQKPGKIYQLKKTTERYAQYYLQRLTLGRIQLYDKSTYAHYGNWYQKHDPTYDFYAVHLRDDLLKSLRLNPTAVKRLMQQAKKNGLGYHHLSRVVTLCIWYDQFMNKRKFSVSD